MTDLDQANALYRAFRETKPKRARKIEVKLPKAVALMGTCEFIGYMTTHKGQVALYIHEFAPGSRPHLYAGTGRGQLYLFDGRFKVTGLGITDLDPAGRVVHARRRYDVKRKP